MKIYKNLFIAWITSFPCAFLVWTAIEAWKKGDWGVTLFIGWGLVALLLGFLIGRFEEE